ncbi:MAG: hypothetical protein ABL956_12965 [Hyphomonadaceae bacterium]
MRTGVGVADGRYSALPQPSPHETNVYHFDRAFVHSSIGGPFAAIGQVRSSRD